MTVFETLLSATHAAESMTTTTRGRATPKRASGVLAGLGLAASDALALALAALSVRTLVPGAEVSSTVLPMLDLAAGMMVCGKAAAGWYPGYGLLPEARLRRSALAWLGTGAAVSAAAVILGHAGGAAIALFWGAFMLAGLLQVLAAAVVRRWLIALGAWGRPVVVMGAARNVARLEDALRATPEYGYRPVAQESVADTVLWAGPGLPATPLLAALVAAGRRVIVVADLPKLPLSGIHPVRCGGTLGLPLSGPGDSATYRVTKRTVDLALALPLGLLALPVVAAAALLVRRADPGPAFYVQMREGVGGRHIGILKLRTMYLESDRMLDDLLARDPAARAEWEAHFKLRRDPRVLPVIGTFLRASSLDELPQLWNVIRGEMSLVGPRPFPEYHLAAMPEAFRTRRATVVPGLTGLWQISERATADLTAQEALDDYYIAGRTFWGDLWILLQTFVAVVRRRGAY